MTVKHKKKWKDFEICRIKLNPKQAVLGCCAQTLDAYLPKLGCAGDHCRVENGYTTSS